MPAIRPIVIMHVITGLQMGGAEQMLYNLVAHSDQAHWRHVVVSLMDRGVLGPLIEAEGVRIHALGMRRGQPSLGGLWRFFTALRQERPHLLQTWLYHADLLGLAGCWIRRVPVIWNIRSSYHLGLNSLVTRLCAKLSSYPDVVVVNSQAGRMVHTQIGYHPREWRWIPNGFDVAKFAPDPVARRAIRQELGLSEDEILIGLIARYDPLKGHETFLKAAEQLARAEPQVHFVLAGEAVTSENPALRAHLDLEALSGRVHLLGRRADIASLIAALDMATSASYGEGFPNAVGEAMACGIPCVVTDVGDSASIVDTTGIVIPPKDPQALADGWRRLIQLGSEGRQRLGRTARERVRRHFSLEATVRQYEALYCSLVERNECAV